MNPSQYAFDTEHMIANLRPWVDAESPGFDAAAVNRVIDLAEYDLATLGASIERVPGRFGFGDTLRATLGGQHNNGQAEGILIACHADTVHPVGSLQTMPYRREGNKLFGAGVLSAKSGIYICLEALRQLKQSGHTLSLPISVLVVPDKELGFRSSREFIEASARQAKYVLIPEPAADDGGVILGRHATSRFDLDVKVDTARERKSFKPGSIRSPIYEMAQHVIEIENMSTDSYGFSVGFIESGQWANYAEKCSAEVVSVAETAAALAESRKKMLALNSSNPDIGLHVNHAATLPLWEPDESSQQLYDVAVSLGTELGLSLTSSVAAFSSIGNITGSLGIATLDGLGARGLSAHRTRAEYLEIDSLVERGNLLASLLCRLS